MADRRRIITLSPGGRPILELNLETAGAYQAISDTFAYQPGQPNTQLSREPTRYGGDQAVGELNENGTVSWSAFVQGTTPDVVAGNIEALLVSANSATRDRLLEWRPDGSTYSSYFRIAGPATWKPMYKWAEWQGAQAMVVEVTFPARPLVQWDAMTIGDPFDVDSLTDYTFDAATSGDVAVAGKITPVVGAALTVERRARHTVRGYPLLEGQSTTLGVVGSTVTGFKLGATLRGAANTYIEAYLDDNGTNSRLRIDVVTAGSRVNRASVNLASRMSAGGFVAVRCRLEGTVVTAEYFLGSSIVVEPPTTTTSYTLITAEQQIVPGHAGWSWIPQHASASINSWEYAPFVRRNATLPLTVAFFPPPGLPSIPGQVLPGKAPAIADITVAPSGGAAAPVWALLAWADYTDASTAPPDGAIEAESGTLSGGWASSAQAGARGGNDVRATTSGAQTYTADHLLDLRDIPADDFSDRTVDLEVWARVLLTSTLVNPRFTLSQRPYSGQTAGERFTHEYGRTGKPLVKPASGTVYRIVRLGTVTATKAATAGAAVAANLHILAIVDAGSSGVFGYDYLMVAPVRARACGPTGVPLDTSYPIFVPDTNLWWKKIRRDLSATIDTATSLDHAGDHGLGGSLLELPPGRPKLFAKLSSLVPDDATSNTSTEQLAHTATVQLDVTPRSFLLRDA